MTANILTDDIKVLGLDIAKNVFELHGMDAKGRTKHKRKLNRAKVLEHLGTIPACKVALESCGSSHYWAREIMQLGHEVKIVPTQAVARLRSTNKSDAIDAKAICKAALDDDIRPVPVKSRDQQNALSLIRQRRHFKQTSTQYSNRARAWFYERGVVIPIGKKNVLAQLETALADDACDPLERMQLQLFSNTLRFLQEQLEVCDKLLEQYAQSIQAIQYLMTIPGIGIISACSLYAAGGDVGRYGCGRDFAAWIGLVPKISGSGGKTKTGHISKRGDVYLRSLLVQGSNSLWNKSLRARKELSTSGKTSSDNLDPIIAWLHNLQDRAKPKQVICCALANKLARIAFACLKHECRYDPAALSAFDIGTATAESPT